MTNLELIHLQIAHTTERRERNDREIWVSSSRFTPSIRLPNERLDAALLDQLRFLLLHGPPLGSVEIIEDAIPRGLVVLVDDDHAPILEPAFCPACHCREVYSKSEP